MTLKIEKPYEFDPLTDYSAKDRLIIRLADAAFYRLIKTIGRTLRFEARGLDYIEQIKDAGRIPIYTFWHDRIFAGTYYFRGRGIVVITSKSLDGEYIARFIKRLGYGSVRGSSSRGGVGALVEMIRLMRQGLPMGFTIDGPRGPRYEAKKGAVLLAKKTGNPVLPFVVEVENFWRLKSWDRMQIPKPFSRASVLIGEPIYVPADADEDSIESHRLQVQQSLDSLVAAGEQWRLKLKNGNADQRSAGSSSLK